MRAKLALFVLGAGSLLAQPDSFVLRIDSPSPYTPTYIGNGYLGVATSPLGIGPNWSYLAGLYDHANGDIPRIAGLPAWNEVNFFDGTGWLNEASADSRALRSYHQSLNMYDGSLRTQYEWDDGGRVTSLFTEMFVSRTNPNLAAVKFQVTTHESGPVKVALSLRGWPAPKRYALAVLEKIDPQVTQQEEWYPGQMVVDDCAAEASHHEGLLRISSHPEGGQNIAVSEVSALAWLADLPGVTIKKSASQDVASVEIAFNAVAEKPYTFYKYVAIVRSTSAEDSLPKATRLAKSSMPQGYDALLAESAAEWHRLWQTDIVVDSTPEFQTLVHSMMFYLMASARADLDSSIPPMGLTTGGYYGHVFWDADTYMFPPLMVLHPEMAKPIVMFRYRTLEAAKANALKNGWKGAMYPWEAGPDGSETTPKFAWQNATSEIHVNGDVALAQWQYYLATGDREWLARYGYPVLKGTADFWVSRATYDPAKDRYEIRNVVSWIESRIGVDNDPYTNGVAAKNLQLAIAAAKLVGEKPDPDWEKVERKLYLPGGATLLESYLLGRPITVEEKKKGVEDALQEFARKDFSVMMGTTFYPSLAVESGSQKLLDEVLPYTYKPYLMPNFNVLREAPDNSNINFLTGAGGFLQQFIFGYPGLRFSEEGLTQEFKPMLPAKIKKLTVKNATVRGVTRDIVVER